MRSAPPTQLLTLKDGHGAPLAEYMYYPADKLLYVRWHGHLTGAEVVRGVQQGGQWRDQLDYSYILNDKSDTGGDWSEALPWLQYEWLPLAVSAGVKAMAYVFSPDRENQFATQTFVAALRPHMAIELFDNMDVALAWLHQQKSLADSTAVLPAAQ
ncbi:hypothetical protein Q3A66_18705 [Hymenobacter sp. BT770]|uniref:hypothetical protein n=1 Tax=Hymenobacter sp. BT770 TaxID=2886942 RepID=UPI001D12BFC5|nr:hypothetical protein [Hymenobacter sp. BT770]MCC3151994.1 hypothetical protein [Hymenobacter sp. BT770]MDO3417104.1 hypothetical protein [Hymenobacter sp. BT770]